jgi:hypothetical protein
VEHVKNDKCALSTSTGGRAWQVARQISLSVGAGQSCDKGPNGERERLSGSAHRLIRRFSYDGRRHHFGPAVGPACQCVID